MQGVPHIKAGITAVGPPGVGDRLHALVQFPPGVLQIVEVDHDVLDAQITRGEDIGPLKGGHQDHLDGPDTDTFDLCEIFDDGLIGERLIISLRQVPFDKMLGNVLQVA